uniref:cAMP responsive element binding protein 3 like 2 n=1 Tax=Rousettus aegyptiacus TaxID=9407 RepID=A0A7J8D4Q5_ROUAE|nr:cAMP responsive element binding protein 3 like 2 [Rousettus aegyptiacus]
MGRLHCAWHTSRGSGVAQLHLRSPQGPVYSSHFSELLDEFSQNVLGQLLNDPFLSEKSVSMEVEPSPTSPAPLIQAEHSYSLCEEPRVQSPFTHVTSSDSFNDGKLSRRDTWGLGIFDLELLEGGGSVRYLLSGPTLSTCLPTLRKAWCVGCGEMPCREARDTFPYLRPCSLGTCSSRMVIIAFFDLVDWTAQ